jgi:hypothetical protein
VHHNADEPSVLDYNTNFKTPAQIDSLYAPDRFRTSDHDPVLAGLDLGVAASISGIPPAGKVGAAYSFAYTLDGSQPATTTVTSGTLPPGLTLNGGTLVGTPTSAGDFTFTVRAGNAFGSGEVTSTVHIDPTATTTVVTSSASPAIVGSAVTFKATVTGGSLGATGGTVQFTVDGKPLGGPVAVTSGVAVSGPAKLDLGQHAVTASFSGNGSFLAGSGSFTQVVQYAVKVLTPTPGAKYKAGSLVPVSFQLTDANGKPIPHLTAVLMIISGQVKVSASGAQSLPTLPSLYDPLTSNFFLPWLTSPRGKGAVTITITITTPAQTHPIPITLT